MRSRIAAAVLAVTAAALIALPAASPPAAHAASSHNRAMKEARGVSFVDQQVEAGILLLQGYINTHGAGNAFVFPTKAMVKKGGGLVAPIWPADPWTGKTMAPGTGRGSYTYTMTSANGTSYKLVGHLSKGSFKVTGGVPKWLAAERAARDDQVTELGARILKGYVDIWGLLHSATPPAAQQMAATGDVGTAHPFWPTDPYTGAAMSQDTAAGDFSYSPGASGAYTLTAHLSGGALVDLSGSVP